MPVKRRAHTRRIDPAIEAAAWADAFDSGYDFFGDLSGIGVLLDEHGRPDEAMARAAWLRLGAQFMEGRQPDPARKPWAVETFGEPPCR